VSEDPDVSGFDREPVAEEPTRQNCFFWLGLMIVNGVFWFIIYKAVYAWMHR